MHSNGDNDADDDDIVKSTLRIFKVLRSNVAVRDKLSCKGNR